MQVRHSFRPGVAHGLRGRHSCPAAPPRSPAPAHVESPAAQNSVPAWQILYNALRRVRNPPVVIRRFAGADSWRSGSSTSSTLTQIL
jgi:hypothetical protein